MVVKMQQLILFLNITFGPLRLHYSTVIIFMENGIFLNISYIKCNLLPFPEYQDQYHMYQTIRYLMNLISLFKLKIGQKIIFVKHHLNVCSNCIDSRRVITL